jgi:GNAT superfamily N-acetyltransferase
MAPKPVIRAVKPGDIEDVVRLCAEHAVYEKAQFSPEGKADRLRSALFAGVPRLWCFVAEAGGSIVGYATCTRDFSTWKAADYLYMDCLFIDPEYRNAGLGTEMMRVIARRAGALGCATLEWQTPAWNASALRFYERLGARASDKLRFCWTPSRRDF